MSQLAKVLQILDLFTEERTTLAAEEIADLMSLPRTTAFRHLRQLCDAGLLTRLSSRYALGSRIIHLDYKIRRYDPLLLASQDLMKALASGSQCSSVLCSLYGEEVLAVHVEPGPDISVMTFGRGRPFPLFGGAPSKVILANLPLPRIRQFYARHSHMPEVRAMGADVDSFLRTMRECRKRGYYLSHGEVDPDITGLASAIFNADGHVIGSVGFAFESSREQLFNVQTLAGMLMNAAAQITARLREGNLAVEPQPAPAPAPAPAAVAGLAEVGTPARRKRTRKTTSSI